MCSLLPVLVPTGSGRVPRAVDMRWSRMLTVTTALFDDVVQHDPLAAGAGGGGGHASRARGGVAAAVEAERASQAQLLRWRADAVVARTARLLPPQATMRALPLPLPTRSAEAAAAPWDPEDVPPPPPPLPPPAAAMKAAPATPKQPPPAAAAAARPASARLVARAAPRRERDEPTAASRAALAAVEARLRAAAAGRVPVSEAARGALLLSPGRDGDEGAEGRGPVDLATASVAEILLSGAPRSAAGGGARPRAPSPARAKLLRAALPSAARTAAGGGGRRRGREETKSPLPVA